MTLALHFGSGPVVAAGIDDCMPLDCALPFDMLPFDMLPDPALPGCAGAIEPSGAGGVGAAGGAIVASGAGGGGVVAS